MTGKTETSLGQSHEFRITIHDGRREIRMLWFMRLWLAL